METAVRDREVLKKRSKDFALRVIHLCDSLPAKPSSKDMASQLVRSGTSVAANYRAAQRARSKAEFIAKVGICLEEADETVFWLELLQESGHVKAAPVKGYHLRSGTAHRYFLHYHPERQTKHLIPPTFYLIPLR